MNKFFAQVMAHKVVSLVTAAAVIGGVAYAVQRGSAADETVRYVTAAAERGTLVVSVTGSGQVDVLDKVEVKPETSGKLAALRVQRDQAVEQGQILAELDSSDARKAIRDAQVAYDSAKAKLDEMLAGADATALTQAENAVRQAQRDLDKAVETRAATETDDAEALADAYEDGYETVSTALFTLAGYVEDLKDVMGDKSGEDAHLRSYRLILGERAAQIEQFSDDYYRAKDAFFAAQEAFRTTGRSSDRVSLRQLASEMRESAETVSDALESARRMFDAIVLSGYESMNDASRIDAARQTIKADVASMYGELDGMRRAEEAIDDLVKDMPGNLADADEAIVSAKERLQEKELALADLKAGTDPLDLASQRNTVDQRRDALTDAQEALGEHVIRAAFAGTVAEVDTSLKPGSAVSASTVLATIITEQQVATLTLNEVDVADVRVGQKATITFDAVEDLMLTGQVAEVDALGEASQGVVSYGVTVALDAVDPRIKPGMSLTAAIVIDVRTDALLVPNSAIKYQGDARFVEMLGSDGKPASRDVEAGLSNDLMTEIVGGLEEGEEVVTQTIKPTAAAAASGQNGRSIFSTGGAGGGTATFRASGGGGSGGFAVPAR